MYPGARGSRAALSWPVRLGLGVVWPVRRVACASVLWQASAPYCRSLCVAFSCYLQISRSTFVISVSKRTDRVPEMCPRKPIGYEIYGFSILTSCLCILERLRAPAPPRVPGPAGRLRPRGPWPGGSPAPLPAGRLRPLRPRRVTAVEPACSPYSSPHSRWRKPDALATGRSMAERSTPSDPMRVTRRRARVTAV